MFGNFDMKTKCFRALILVQLLAITCATAEILTNRPANWAQPRTLPGVANFYEVSTNLYRGAQPTALGMAQLQTLGVRSVISLRSPRLDRRELRGSGMKSLDLGMVPWRVTENQVVKFLQAATDTNNLPAFVHCKYGADRTGLMCAMYRIVVCGWSKQEAIAEMKDGGFNFGRVWKNLISFIEKADIADIKRRVGLPATELKKEEGLGHPPSQLHSDGFGTVPPLQAVGAWAASFFQVRLGALVTRPFLRALAATRT